MTAAERVLDGWAADAGRRARHHAAVIAAAHRAVAEALDTDPTPPHGIARLPVRIHRAAFGTTLRPAELAGQLDIFGGES